MAKSDQLRQLRAGTVINRTSKRQEKDIVVALREVEQRLSAAYPNLKLHYISQWLLRDIVDKLRQLYPDIDFRYYFDTSSIRPDGGILSLVDKKDNKFPILIGEAKNQGTNEKRLAGIENFLNRCPMKRNEIYLGDGLYASFDGYHVVLRAPRMGGDHYVALEPSVMRALQDYYDHLKEERRARQESQEAEKTGQRDDERVSGEGLRAQSPDEGDPRKSPNSQG